MAWTIAVIGAAALPLVGLALAVRTEPAGLRLLMPRRGPTASGAPTLFGRIRSRVGASRLGEQLATRIAGRAMLRRRIDQSGTTWTVRDLAGLELTVAGAGVVVVLVASLSAPPLLALAPFAAALGAKAPELSLARTARRRLRRMAGQVPELVELLVAATEAGLPPAGAFVRASRALSEPLGDELRTAVRQVGLGVPWRAALDRAVDRTGAAGLRELSRTLSRAQRAGVSTRASLRAVADDFRAERRARAEELARRAPVKMLFPLVLLILPAFLLLTVGPVLLSTIRSLH